MGVGPLSQRNGKRRKDESVVECYTLVAGEATEKAGDRCSWQAPLGASQSNSSHVGQKGRPPTEMLSCSVGLLWLFPGLATLQEDLHQRQEDGHSHRQEKRDIDGKLLVIREIKEMEERGVKKGTLRGCHSFLAGSKGRGQVSRGQLFRCLLDCSYSPVHLGRGQGNTN